MMLFKIRFSNQKTKLPVFPHFIFPNVIFFAILSTIIAGSIERSIRVALFADQFVFAVVLADQKPIAPIAPRQ